MGDYTELVFKAEINKDIPKDVYGVLDFLFNNAETPNTLPNHVFFKCDRWEMIGRCCSAYHVPWPSSRYEENIIFSRSDLKNYDGEIDSFLAWVEPYIKRYMAECFGWIWYDADDSPIMIDDKYLNNLMSHTGVECDRDPEIKVGPEPKRSQRKS